MLSHLFEYCAVGYSMCLSFFMGMKPYIILLVYILLKSMDLERCNSHCKQNISVSKEFITELVSSQSQNTVHIFSDLLEKLCLRLHC